MNNPSAPLWPEAGTNVTLLSVSVEYYRKFRLPLGASPPHQSQALLRAAHKFDKRVVSRPLAGEWDLVLIGSLVLVPYISS